MYKRQIQGVCDNELRKDLSAVKYTDLVKCNLLIDADMQAKIMVKSMSRSIPPSSYHNPSQSSKKGGVHNQLAPSSLSKEEKKRRKIFKCKCFRCGSGDHMQPACKLPSSITYNVRMSSARPHIPCVFSIHKCTHAATRLFSSCATPLLSSYSIYAGRSNQPYSAIQLFFGFSLCCSVFYSHAGVSFVTSFGGPASRVGHGDQLSS